MSINTNWYVITGAPCAGKTTIIEKLASLGYLIVPEASRALIDAEIKQGKTTQDIRNDDAAFQKRVLEIKVEVEDNLPPEQITFIDGGAVPSTIAYYRVGGLDPTLAIEKSQKRRYKRIFFLERLPLQTDYARVEDEQTVQRLDKAIYRTYLDLGYDVVRVPPKSTEERIELILSRMDKQG